MIPAAVLLRVLSPLALAAGGAEPLIDKARALRLWEDRSWTLLLHRGTGVLGRRSEISNPEFFLAPDGRSNPQAELEATLKGFFAQADDPDSHPACLYPARRAWLEERLGGEAAGLPGPACPKFETWRSDLSADSVSLVFASAFLSNPSSMYGHTFLRLDQRAHEGRRLLDHAVNFAALAPEDGGPLYEVYGLTGVFVGKFSAMPYYLKVQEYANFESRDLWEYKLHLDSAAIARLVEHTWELGRADFPYYFLNKNCSYQLLPLLEAAEPSARLVERWPLYVIPADTVRSALDLGLAGEAVYRPSLVTRMLAAREALAPEEVRAADALAKARPGAWEKLDAFPPERRAAVLDAAGLFLEYRLDFRKDREEALKESRRRLLVARGRLGLPSTLPEPPRPAAPHEGHRSGRLSAGVGASRGALIELGWRPGLHDLLDPPAGYAPAGALEMAGVRLRHDRGAKRTYLKALDFARIVSFSPFDPWIKKPSWGVDFGIRTAGELDPREWKTGHLGLTGASGFSIGSRLAGREVWYALAEVDAGWGGALRMNHRAGGGGSAGVFAELSSRWRAKLEGGYRAYALGDKRPRARLALEQGLDLGRDLTLRLALERLGNRKEAFFSVQRHY